MRFVELIIYIKISCLVILLIFLPTFLILISVNCIEQRRCNIYSEVTGKQTKYYSFDSCYVEIDGEFQRLSEYKARIVASEGLSKLNN